MTRAITFRSQKSFVSIKLNFTHSPAFDSGLASFQNDANPWALWQIYEMVWFATNHAPLHPLARRKKAAGA